VSPEADRARTDFLRRLTQERALSAHTRAAYQRDLDGLARWCDVQGIGDWARLDHGHVRTFSAHSHAKGLGARSIQRRLSALRSF
jgi:integrase/recombinase XerC